MTACISIKLKKVHNTQISSLVLGKRIKVASIVLRQLDDTVCNFCLKINRLINSLKSSLNGGQHYVQS